MTEKLDLTTEQLDLLIADIARRAPVILPVLRRVKDGSIGYIELTRAHTRVLRLGPVGSRPMVALIADPEGRGPDGFAPAGFMHSLFGRAGGVVIVCDDQDDVPYEIAAAHAGERRRHVILVETERSAIEAWTSFAYDAGVEPDNVTAFIAEPGMPDGLYRDVPVEDVPPAPRRPVH